jgi:hypothetical protein
MQFCPDPRANLCVYGALMGAFLTRELPSELPAGLSAFRQISACMGRFIHHPQNHLESNYPLCWVKILLQKLIVAHQVVILLAFYQYEISLLCSQESSPLVPILSPILLPHFITIYFKCCSTYAQISQLVPFLRGLQLQFCLRFSPLGQYTTQSFLSKIN